MRPSTHPSDPRAVNNTGKNEGQRYFQLETIGCPELEHTECVQSKIYDIHGVVLEVTYFDGSYYVCLADASSAKENYDNRGVGNGLHDARWGDVSTKRVGVQVRTYTSTDLPDFPEARKLLLWQTAPPPR